MLEKLKENFDVEDAGVSFTRVVLDSKFEDEVRAGQPDRTVDPTGQSVPVRE